MKVQISTDLLTDAMKAVAPLTKGSKTLSVLKMVRLEARDGYLLTTTSDLDITVRWKSECRLLKEGGGLVDADNLKDVAGRIEEESVEFELEENYWLEVTDGNSKARMRGAHPDDFPDVLDLDAAECVPIEPDGLLELIDRTAHAIGQDEDRVNLTGALLECTGDSLRMTATDGHRLAMAAVDVDGHPFDEPMVIPRQAIKHVAKIIDAKGPPVELGRLESSVIFRQGDFAMAARLIEASFPSPETILPDSFETAAHVSRDILADTAKFVEIFAPRKTRQVKLTFEDGHLELYATDPDTGEGRRALPIDYDGAEPTESVGMNCRYLRDALDCIDDDTVEVASRGAHGVFTLREPGNDDHLQLIMPMRL